ncbi:hypothetical protein PVL29_020969 [Vitis rotundifolia]|uniref:Uncharacterized protein n=1 Tax=Vitis rotundifolia TaxID=103349 RepID=A0AA39DCP7_VITRO|nr:hypothetical protein PVL29_020969 [Vitis rotundifolia]
MNFHKQCMSFCQLRCDDITKSASEGGLSGWELFRVACDQAEEFVESVKQRIGSECLVDEATGSIAGKSGQVVTIGLPPICAHGSGTAGGPSHSHVSTPFDARFSEDAAQ